VKGKAMESRVNSRRWFSSLALAPSRSPPWATSLALATEAPASRHHHKRTHRANGNGPALHRFL
jgi:hypothetical protein